jgi:hypothetical protein
MLCLFRWLTDASDEIKQSSFPPNTFPPSHYYKQSTRIVAEPPYKLLKLHTSLMRRVFVTALVQRRAGDHAEHPKFAGAASMGIRWFQASRHIMTHSQQVMLHVSFNDFREVKDVVCGSHADSVLAAVWSPWSRLGHAFATQFRKFLFQPNSTLLLGMTCILSHWTLGFCFGQFVYVIRSYGSMHRLYICVMFLFTCSRSV